MPGGVFSTAKLHAMTIRESANDGSDFTNPDADYRRLFLGEDGYLHVKDSAGTVTDPYNVSGGGVNLTGAYDIEGDGSPTYTDAGMSDEFAGSLDAQWTAVGFSGTGTIDLSQTNIADSIYDVATHSGTLFFQVDQSDKVGIRQDAMIANGEQIIVSMSVPYPLETAAGGTNNGFRCGIAVNDTDTNYDAGTYRGVIWDGTDVSRVIHYSGATIYGESTTGAIAGGRVYFKMWRAADVLHFAWSKDGTVWSYLASVSVTGFTNFWVFADCSQAAGTDNAPIVPIHWVRHVANTNYYPW